jgi:CRP-like cAMP-binding protein
MMPELKQLLAEHLSVVSFDEDEITMLSEIADLVEFQEGEILFQETDPGDSIYLVATGGVDLYTCLNEDVEQTLMTVRQSGFVGALALVDDGARDVNARATEVSSIYKFDGQALNSLSATNHGLGIKLLRFVSDLLSKRMRLMIASLKQNLEWTLKVSGLATLNISQLIIDQATVEIELVNGKQLSGTIIKAEDRQSGFELFLATNDRTVHFIPYHAIASASLPSDAIKTNLDESTSY